MKGCWFDGTMTQTYVGKDTAQFGGLIGTGADKDNDGATIATCLFTGKMTLNFKCTNATQGTWGGRIGGFAGWDGTKSMTIKNSISAGEIKVNWLNNGSTKPNSVIRTNPTIGWIQNASTTTNGNVYYVPNSVSIYIEHKDTTTVSTEVYKTDKTITFNTVSIAKDALLGADGGTLTKLTFGENGWTKRDGKVPVPTALKDVK